jgi:hypothetical protein
MKIFLFFLLNFLAVTSQAQHQHNIPGMSDSAMKTMTVNKTPVKKTTTVKKNQHKSPKSTLKSPLSQKNMKMPGMDMKARNDSSSKTNMTEVSLEVKQNYFFFGFIRNENPIAT